MLITMNFTSAESLTRFLRGKDVGPAEVAATGHALLLGAVAVHLPNAAQFLFELVCDRMNDHAKFLRWKLQPELWQLWAETWTRLGHSLLDVEVRSKIFRRVKLVSVITAMLDQAAQPAPKGKKAKQPAASVSVLPVLPAMFGAVKVFTSSGFIAIDEFSAVSLLGSYVNVIHSMDALTLEAAQVNSWTALVHELYSLPHQSATYKPSKKSTAKYFGEVLPVQLAVLALRPHLELDDTYAALHSIFVSVLFGPHQTALASNIQTLIESGSSLTAQAVTYLFEQVIAHLAAKDITMCEIVFETITKDKFALLAEQLLAILSKVNKALSTTFFQRIYDTETAKKDPNWRLVAYLVNLDPELCLAKWRDVVDACSSASEESITFLAENLAQGFVRARDYSLFLSTVYPHALQKNSGWKCDAVVAELASRVNELSGNQIRALTKTFLDEQAHQPLCVLLRGLLSCSPSKQDQSKLLFADYAFCFPGCPQIAYYVLCIYGAEVSESHPELLEKVVNSESWSQYDVYLSLRVAELSGQTDKIDAKAFKKYLSGLTSAAEVTQLFERWLVLLACFGDLHSAFFQRLFALCSKDEVLGLLQANLTILFELPPMLTSLLSYLQTQKMPYKYDIFTLLPPIVLRKFFAQFQTEICKEAETSPKNISARKALVHILEQPTLSSSIEKNYTSLWNLIDSATPDTQDLSIKIATNVWNAHLANFKDQASKLFVEGCIASLQKAFAQKPKKVDLAMAKIVLSTNFQEISAAQNKLMTAYITTHAKQKPDDLQSYLSSLAELQLSQLDKNGQAAIKKVISKYGSGDISPKSKSLLFSLVTQISTEQSAAFVVSLFVALDSTSEKQQDLQNLSDYLRKLSTPTFNALYSSTVKAILEAPPQFIPSLVDLVTALVPLLNKQHHEEHTKIFIASILAVADRMADLTQHGPDSLLRFLTRITSMVSDHMWAFKQYTVELTLALVDLVARRLPAGPLAEQLYTATTNLLSYIVLFQRFRLSSRYHLVIAVMSSLMQPLTAQGKVAGSVECAKSYARLVTSLCEPQVQGSKSNELTSQAAIYKRALRKYAHMLLVNYVHLQLTSTFSGEVNDALVPAIHSIFTLLSKTELHLVNQCLDTLGKTYYRTLYSGYREHGKWKDA